MQQQHLAPLPLDGDQRTFDSAQGGCFLSLVVPCYNEAKNIAPFMAEVRNVLDNSGYDYEVVFVNDGSRDATLANLVALQQTDSRVVVVDLSRNFGKESALSAGLSVVRGRVVVPLDADLQHPPAYIPQFIDRWLEGYDVVLARRKEREGESWLKKMSAKSFYNLHNTFSPVKLPENVGDFRLMDRSVVDVINALPENCRFMKGLFAWVGFRVTTVDFDCPPRVVGETKFTPLKLWNFALDGITSFSTAPLRIWTYIGFLMAFVTLCYGLYLVLKTAILGIDVPGYASIMTVVIFLGGLQLIGIGILGEYLGRNFMESKRRPVFIIRRIYKQEDV